MWGVAFGVVYHVVSHASAGRKNQGNSSHTFTPTLPIHGIRCGILVIVRLSVCLMGAVCIWGGENLDYV